MANNYFKNLGSALFGRNTTYSNVEGDDLFNSQRKPPTAADAIKTPTESELPSGPNGEGSKTQDFLALLGKSAGAAAPSFASPGSITPNFGRIGDGGGAASGLGPIVQAGPSPLAGLEGPASAGMSAMMDMWKKRQATKAGELKAAQPKLTQYDL